MHITIGSVSFDVSLVDLAMLASAILSAAWAFLVAHVFDRLPKAARQWLARKEIDPAAIQKQALALIAGAEALKEMTADQRRAYVAEKLQQWTWKHAGVRVPTSIANLIIEVAYQAYRKRVKK